MKVEVEENIQTVIDKFNKNESTEEELNVFEQGLKNMTKLIKELNVFEQGLKNMTKLISDAWMHQFGSEPRKNCVEKMQIGN